MAAFDYAISVLADPDFVSSLDTEADDAPTVTLDWQRARNSHTGVPCLYWRKQQQLWQVLIPTTHGRKDATRRNLADALNLWAQRTCGDIERAREALQARGLL